jgi:2'-5' RNA ligase
MNTRIFFGLWPSQETAGQLMDWVRDAHALCGGRMMAPDTLHLTLAFLGSVPAELADELAKQAGNWPARVGPLTLRRYGRFEGPRIVWAGPGLADADYPEWLDELYKQLWQRLASYGFSPDHAVFRPHVSLLRRAGPGDPATLPRRTVTWVPQQCVLVASQPSDHASRYKVLARMPLQVVAGD